MGAFFSPAIRTVASCPAHARARRIDGAGRVHTGKANGERQSKPIRQDAAQLRSQSISALVQRSTKERGDGARTTAVAPWRVNLGHVAHFQAEGDGQTAGSARHEGSWERHCRQAG